MLKRILIACRGEIALRIIRCCKELGVETVAAHSKADADSLPVQLATHRICIGAVPARQSYLDIDAVLNAAHLFDCDAVHPGYGFLSESSAFADRCTQMGLKFIGPSAQVIAQMGSKSVARDCAQRSGMPVVPGSEGVLTSLEEAQAVAQNVGYPVLLKAVSGGGGRGMRRCDDAQALARFYPEARAEAAACFNDDRVYLEKLILNPRHIEIQIMADTHGNVVHLGERDCSIQRNHQKMMEETPSRAITAEMRHKMGMDAVNLAKSVGYTNAGTIEYVLAPDGNYYFIEMNTRIQVEHPITEQVYGVDLIAEQLRVASGLPLSFTQAEMQPRCHAIECRINAESPLHNFRPSAGAVSVVHFPSGMGVRVDSALYSGSEVSPFYDSLAAKIITFAPTRLQAIRRMRSALSELIIDGIDTTADLLYTILYHPDFLKGKYNTAFIGENLDNLLQWCDTDENRKHEDEQ